MILSDVIYEGKWVHVNHVKEFIKELKEELFPKDFLFPYIDDNELHRAWAEEQRKKINKKAGKELI